MFNSRAWFTGVVCDFDSDLSVVHTRCQHRASHAPREQIAADSWWVTRGCRFDSSTENALSRVSSDGSGRPSDQYKRDRPTSAPVIREDMEYQPPAHFQRQPLAQQHQRPITRETFEPVVTEYIAEVASLPRAQMPRIESTRLTVAVIEDAPNWSYLPAIIPRTRQGMSGTERGDAPPPLLRLV